MRRYGYVFLWLSLIPAVLFCHTSGVAVSWCSGVLPCLRSALARLTSAAAFPVCSVFFLPFAALAVFCCTSKSRAFLPCFAGFLILSISLTWLAPCALSEDMNMPDPAHLQQLCKEFSQQAVFCKPERRDFIPENVLIEASRLTGAGITPKPALFPSAAKALGIAGWWSPLTSEAVVDATLSELNLPFVACHELMHAKGVASEAQANYLAYLACMQGDAIFRYSGTMNALWYAMRCLRDTDESAWEAAVSDMDTDVRANFCRMNGLAEAAPSPLSALQDTLTRLYLSLSGTADYDAFAAWLVFSE